MYEVCNHQYHDHIRQTRGLLVTTSLINNDNDDDGNDDNYDCGYDDMLTLVKGQL